MLILKSQELHPEIGAYQGSLHLLRDDRCYRLEYVLRFGRHQYEHIIDVPEQIFILYKTQRIKTRKDRRKKIKN